ncbi:MAG: acyltransferase family protein [Chloroflexota bacterium]
MARATTSAPARPRVTYVDWLRVLAVLLLIPFHSARLFDTLDSFYVKNAETSIVFTAFIGFLGSWHMPLLFVLAGAATWFALGWRSPWQYAFERFRRLLLPLVFGVLVVVPPQMYFAQRFHGAYTGSYFDFYPGFFQQISGSDYPGIGFSYAHLWFVLFLFVMSLLALPLLALLRGRMSSRPATAVATFFAQPGAILLLALPLPFTSMAEDPLGHNFTLFIILFVYGYLLMSDARYQRAAYDSRWLATALGVVVTLAYFALVLGTGTDGEENDLPSVLFQFAFNFSAWFWTVAALGFGQRYLRASGPLLTYASEAAYPFYILHQTVIVVLGYYVVPWPVAAWLKFAALALGSLALTLGLYDLGVRRFNPVRFLFGMKPRARTPRPVALSGGKPA